MCIWAKASRSRGRIASIAPAGAFERASAHTGAGSYPAPGLGSMWPTAARNMMASYGLVAEWVRPSGAKRYSRRHASYGFSRSTSTRRPSTQKPALL